ncbi:hypothetical protein ACFWPQ_01710 [Streptomyces sp. NPDC058464]|uniref:hypothetical protein n=1 Tax=Streptomyces sp. NPDC058464 TaxID=3346511 RepID=UPI003657328D
MAAARKTAVSQFPAKAGNPEAEVAQRSTDGSDNLTFVKEFVVTTANWPDGDDAAHDANKEAVLNEAIQRGLHPRGDVSFDGTTAHADGVSTVLTYSVETIPASVDRSPQDTITPRDLAEGED